MKDKQLAVEIKDDQLVISIGVETLKHACTVGRRYGLDDVVITDDNKFLKCLARQLKSEQEDGTTLIHEAFDSAVSEILEYSDCGMDFKDD